MSYNITNVFITQFESMVHHEYQLAGGELDGTVRVKEAKAKEVKFPVMGNMITQVAGPAYTDVTPYNPTHEFVTATPVDYECPAYTKIFQQEKINFDEQQELAKSVAMALKRRETQFILDALNAGTYTKTVADTISGSADNLTVDALRSAAKQLDDDGVPGTDRFLTVSPSGLHHLLESTETTSSDFNTVKALVQGDLDTFYGFKFKKIGTMPEGGLEVPSANHRTTHAWHKDAVGLAINIRPKIRIDYVPHKGSWLVYGILSGGGILIDAKGAVEITTDES